MKEGEGGGGGGNSALLMKEHLKGLKQLLSAQVCSPLPPPMAWFVSQKCQKYMCWVHTQHLSWTEQGSPTSGLLLWALLPSSLHHLEV